MVFIHLLYNLAFSASIPVMRILAFLGHSKFKALLDMHSRAIAPPVLDPGNSYAWFHCASLGEYEQASPVIVEYISLHPNTPVLLTLFSPSGFNPLTANPPSWMRQGDHITALPLDTPRRVRTFLRSFKYQIKFFAAAKYEVWPQLLMSLKSANPSIPTYVFAAHIPPHSQLTKSGPSGKFLRWTWSQLTDIFTQDSSSTSELSKFNISSTPLGDPRVDRVIHLASQCSTHEKLKDWKGSAHLTIAGSSWYDEEVALATLPWDSSRKLLIAPHEVDSSHVSEILNRFNATSPSKVASLLSENTLDTPVVIVDLIGLLTSLYPLADLAIVGGGFSKGIHNVLEPAVHGVSVITGPNINRFREAIELQSEGVLIAVNEQNKFAGVVWDYISKPRPSSSWLTLQSGAARKIASQLP